MTVYVSVPTEVAERQALELARLRAVLERVRNVYPSLVEDVEACVDRKAAA